MKKYLVLAALLSVFFWQPVPDTEHRLKVRKSLLRTRRLSLRLT
jgi:acyl-CoA hydrolase